MRFRDACRLTLALFAAAATFAALPARAEIAITIDRGNFQPMPIAITDFGSADPALGQQISAVITADLRRSGVFAPVDRKAFIEKVSSIDTAPQFESWKAINAQALVTGRISRDASGRL